MARTGYGLTGVLGILFLSLAAGICGIASAQVPDKLNYQGRLTDPGGTPVTASVPMVFKLYTVASGGAALYTETQTVSVAGGVFNVAIGSVTPLNLPFDVPYFLGVQVGADAEMAPRQAVLSSAYAQRADTANALVSSATVSGAQITGAISAATLAAAEITGTLATGQLGDGSVTKPKLSAAGGSAGQVLGTDGANLQWQSAGGAGTVTSVGTGAGLTGGPITTSGTIAVDPTSSTLTGNFFKKGGNAFGGLATLGTSDNNPMEVNVNGARAMRFQPDPTSPNIIGGHANNSVGAFSGQTIGGGGLSGNTCIDPVSTLPTRTCGNVSSGDYATVAGGISNSAAVKSAVGGGSGNTASGDGSTVAGGYYNIASGFSSIVGGGERNTASGDASTVAGGDSNYATGHDATVAGGFSNSATGPSSAVTGGAGNVATDDYSTVAGGLGNTASGLFAVVAGGQGNIASGAASFAAGSYAMTQSTGGAPTIHNGVFIWADAHGNNFNSSADNEFATRATGGVRFVTNIDGAGNALRTVSINSNGEMNFGSVTRQMLKLWDFGTAHYGIGVQSFTEYFRTDASANFAWFAGGSHSDTTFDPGSGGALLMTLTPSSSTSSPTGIARAQSFVSISDRNVKAGFAPVDAGAVLAHVVALPVTTWVYRTDPSTPHIGPVAQDFHAAFRVGSDDRTINTTDEGGVALAAIQGLNAKLEREVARQENEIAELRRHVHDLESLIQRVAPAGNPIEPVSHPKVASAVTP